MGSKLFEAKTDDIHEGKMKRKNNSKIYQHANSSCRSCVFVSQMVSHLKRFPRFYTMAGLVKIAMQLVETIFK